MTDHFSQDDARRIFARAAERQHATEARGEGLTLAELQAIGREAGLEPEHVAAAVAEMHLLPDAEPVLVSGVDVTPRRSRVVPAELTDEMWEQWVGRLRRTYTTKGVPTRVGRIREWQSGPNSALHVVAEPVPGGTRVTLETSKLEYTNPGASPAGGVVGGLLLAAGLGLLFGLGDFEPLILLLPALVAVLSLVLGYAMRAHLARWSATRTGQFDALLDQFELIARDAAAVEDAAVTDGTDADVRPAAPALDLDRLGDAPEAGAPSRRRRRDRA